MPPLTLRLLPGHVTRATPSRIDVSHAFVPLLLHTPHLRRCVRFCAAPRARAPPPARTQGAPPPARQQQASGGGLMSGLMGTVAQGMAFGAGSEVAHQGVRSMMGGSSGHAPGPEAAPEAAAPHADACAPSMQVR